MLFQKRHLFKDQGFYDASIRSKKNERLPDQRDKYRNLVYMCQTNLIEI